MIGAVHRALRGLLTPLLPDACEVRCGAPAPPRPHAGQDGSAVLFFLADIREDQQAGGTDWTDIRDAEGRVIARRPPIRRFDLHYLVTADAPDAETEADLLDAVLIAADPARRLDPALLGDSRSAEGPPVTVRLAADAGAAYARLGLPPRTVVGIIASAPLILPPVTDVAPAADRITLDVGGPGRGSRPGPAGGPAPAGSRRWRGARIEEDADAVRGEDE